jgi:hypothetical protein
VSDEATISPVDVAAIAFEDAHGAVRMFVCNQNDRARSASIEFRGRTIRRRIDAGAMLEIFVGGNPELLDAMPVAVEGAHA